MERKRALALGVLRMFFKPEGAGSGCLQYLSLYTQLYSISLADIIASIMFYTMSPYECEL